MSRTAAPEGDVRVVAAPTDHRPVHPTVGYRFEADGKALVLAGDTIPCEGLDRLWESPEMEPTPNELVAPGLWLARIGADTALPDLDDVDLPSRRARAGAVGPERGPVADRAKLHRRRAHTNENNSQTKRKKPRQKRGFSREFAFVRINRT